MDIFLMVLAALAIGVANGLWRIADGTNDILSSAEVRAQKPGEDFWRLPGSNVFGIAIPLLAASLAVGWPNLG